MWLAAAYQAVSLFSLKASTATSSGGKSLLAPTPFAIKMALLDAACRLHGVAQAQNLWSGLRTAQIALFPAPRVIVTHLFQRILKPTRSDARNSANAFTRTIGYREYVHIDGIFIVAISVTEDGVTADAIESLLLCVNYFGKRGSFVQLVDPVSRMKELPDGFVALSQSQNAFSVEGVAQVLDDCAPSVTFAQVNIYSGKPLKVGKDRLLRNVVLPYRLVRSSRSYTQYERIDR